MKKKIFSLISIFILCFSLAFSFFDKVSFAAEPVTYDVHLSNGEFGRFEGQPGFTPFCVNSYIRMAKMYQNFLVCGIGYDSVDFHKFPHSGNFPYANIEFNGIRCAVLMTSGNINVTYSVSPSVPVIQKDFDAFSEQYAYIAQLLKDPSLIPIDVTNYDSSLGSLKLQSPTSWRFLRYEPFWTGNSILKSQGYSYKIKLRAMFQDTTSTGQKYDKVQIMVRMKNLRSQWGQIFTHPWKDKLPEGEYYSYYLSDLKSPTTVDLQIFDYDKDNDGRVTKLLYPTFQPAFDKLGLKKPAISNEYWFFCDYTICYRPVTSDGKFGDWFYITPDPSVLGGNMLGGGTSISATTGTSASDEDPNSLSFNPLPEDSTSTRTATGNGETLGDAINDSNNSLIGGSITSGGSLTSNITDLFELFTNMPSIIATIFGWLPPWVLSLFSIGFALFVPIFIYKFVRG